MLHVKALSARYGEVQVLHDIDLLVQPGEIVTVVGANAAGKSTLLKSLAGLVQASGSIWLDQQEINEVPAHRRVENGLVLVPEGRRLFPFMSVQENLDLGCYTAQARSRRAQSLAEVYEMLPILHERRNQLAGSLSGGEQQMVAIARGLMARPKVLMLDEPTLGLAPKLVSLVFRTVEELHHRGITILLVEQNARRALEIAQRGYVIENGRIAMTGESPVLLADDRLRRAYLGI